MKMLYASATVGSKLKRIAALGFDGPTEALIKLCIDRQPELMLSDAEQADLLVINGDQGEPSEQLQQRYQSLYSQPGVLISRRLMQWPGYIRLEKPFTSDQFVEALLQAAQQASQPRMVEQPNLERPSRSSAKGEDRRSDAYQAYCSRVAASQSAMQQLQQSRKQQSQQASLLKVRLKQGREASLRAAEDAVQQLTRQNPLPTESAGQSPTSKPSIEQPPQQKPVKPIQVQASLAQTPESALAPKPKIKATTPKVEIEKPKAEAAKPKKKVAKPAIKAAVPDPIPTDFVRPAIGGNYLELDPPLSEPAPLPESPVPVSTPVKAAVEPREIAVEVPRFTPEPMDRAMVDRCCGHNPDLNLRNPNSRRRAFFNTEGSFMAWLPRAVNKARLNQMPVQISGLPSPLIYLPEQDCFWGDFDQELLLQYCLSKFSLGELELRTRPDLSAIEPKGKLDKPLKEPREALIWKVALWTTRGRLTEQLEPETIYTLNFRPNFEQLLMTPGADHITELWHQQSLSANDLIHRLKLHQRFVFAYMSAANALGWLQR